MDHLEDSSTSQTTPGPLSGVLVADFSRVLAGPLTSMFLADLGATGIRASPRMRRWRPRISRLRWRSAMTGSSR